MRAKEFITEYGIMAKPVIAVSNACTKCSGVGNIPDGDKTLTCPLCSGTGSMPIDSDDSIEQGQASDTDHMMNTPDTIWAAGKI